MTHLKDTRTRASSYIAALLLMTLATAAAAANTYPTKPIRVIVPGAPGSGPDIFSRLIGGSLTAAWKQQVITDNRAGGGGTIAGELAFKATPDGYTLFMATSQTLIGSVFFEKLPYRLLEDFSPVCLIASTPFLLVAHPSLPANSVKELISLAKAKPGTLYYGSAGTGGALHFVAETFKVMADINVVHVPYKSVVYALTDVAGGQVQLAFSVIPAVAPLIRQGRVKALGVTTLKRTPLAPEVQPIADAVPGYEMAGWFGLLAPRKTPGAIIAKLNAETLTAVRSAEIHEKLEALGAMPIGTTPREFAAFLLAETEKARKTIKVSGMRPD